MVTGPSGCLSDQLKNSVFERVLILQAQQVPELMGIAAMVKGCEELYLLGDPFLPKTSPISDYARVNNFSVSLFERLYKEGHNFRTFDSRVEDSRLFANVMEWANYHVYGGQLRLLHQESSLVKGFPWPSTKHRICFLHCTQPNPTDLAAIGASVMRSVLKSGYTTTNEISCSVSEEAVAAILREQVKELLREFEDSKSKAVGDALWRMCHEPSGSEYARG